MNDLNNGSYMLEFKSKEWTENTISIKPKKETLEAKRSFNIKHKGSTQNIMINMLNTTMAITTIDLNIEIIAG